MRRLKRLVVAIFYLKWQTFQASQNMIYWTKSNSCCHYNYCEPEKRNPVDDAPELAFPSCVQFHLENVGLQKRSSPAKAIITNNPVNNIARKLEKNAWKNTGGESATDCVRCGRSPFVGFLMAQYGDRKYGKPLWLRCASSWSLYCNFITFRHCPRILLKLRNTEILRGELYTGICIWINCSTLYLLAHVYYKTQKPSFPLIYHPGLPKHKSVIG